MTHEVHLEHAFLSVRNLDRTLAFYKTLFPDWVVRWEGTGMGGNRWLHFGPPGDGRPGYLSLCEFPDAAAPEEAYASIRVQHIGFAHPDVNGLVARLGAEGIEPGDRADDGRYRRVYVDDPDDHELEFVQELVTAARGAASPR
jgi:catechol 2,3-dioxygenase-like lactoylglutathione lyase family enzyme